ncbi:hypothetical protein KY285_024557 [Solanum tuberosum]|nr:hypothetical protein KY285_024557 [Solanum tuberosum]
MGDLLHRTPPETFVPSILYGQRRSGGVPGILSYQTLSISMFAKLASFLAFMKPTLTDISSIFVDGRSGESIQLDAAYLDAVLVPRSEGNPFISEALSISTSLSSSLSTLSSVFEASFSFLVRMGEGILPK